MSRLQARNEATMNAPISLIWSIITDINALHRVNPGVVRATGRMDKQGETRTCEINNNGRKGTMTEKLIELVPEKKTVWTIETDTMGMSKMLKNTRFEFHLQSIGAGKTLVINETYYEPVSLMAKLLNGIMMKKIIRKTQAQILRNIEVLAQKG